MKNQLLHFHCLPGNRPTYSQSTSFEVNTTSRIFSYLHKIIRQALTLFLILFTLSSFAQTEDFEGETVFGTTFTIDGVLFNMTGDFRVSEFGNFSCGGTNSGLNRYMDSGYLTDGPSSGIIGSISPVNSCATFQMDTGTNAQWGWTGTNDGQNQTPGTIRFTGTKPDQTSVSQDISFAPTNTIALVPFTFSNGIWGGVDLISLQMEIVNSPPQLCDYFALDELVFSNITGQFVIFTEDFEDHGNTANGGAGRYSSPRDFMDPTTDDDYWGRIRASDNQYFLTNTGSGSFIHSNVDYTGQHGEFFYAGEDQDDIDGTIGSPDGLAEKEISFTGINISGGSNLRFSGLFARGENDGCDMSTYDETDFIKVYYKIDGGAEVEALCFHADLECNISDDVTNEPLYYDPNCDGDGGEGALLTAVLSPYSFNIAGTGDVLDLRIVVHMDLGDEEVAIDFLQICSSTEVIACTATTSFTAPPGFCVDAGIQTGLGGGIPIGGTYSGPGVIDDGNGQTFSFNPSSVGAGTHSITYTYNEGMGCPDVMANTNIEVYPLPNVTFTNTTNLCIDAGVQTFGGGTPTGGTYSGAGVTDNGDGMTYTFNPTVAGTGTHTITYQFTNANNCSESASDQIEVFALPTVAFTAPTDICINAGVQAGLGGGSPMGGVYSGNGVMDNGNGTYDFDPMTAGAGVHTITYNFSDANGCSQMAMDNLEVFSEPNVLFTAPDDLCLNAGIQTGLGGGTPTGGIYSGPGVTDDGNGMTFSFDPSVVGAGMHTIVYEFSVGNACFGNAIVELEVFALPTVSISLPDTIFVIDGMPPQNVVGGGLPVGGVYTDMFSETQDDGNGETFSFLNNVLVGDTNVITYTYTDVNGCTNSVSQTIFVADGTVGLADLQAINLSLFPNPTTGILNFQGAEIDRIEVIDVHGRIVQVERQPDVSIDISALATGLYFLRLEVDGQQYSTRVVKE